MNAAVIGGGASGMIAAIALAERGANVSIFEHMPRMGRKLLITGSGRCNISNTDMSLSHFHGGNEHVYEAVLKKCPADATRGFFERLGIVYKDRGGYLYPYSEQASAVVDVLRFAIRDLGINVYTGVEIESVTGDTPDKKEGGFCVKCNNKEHYFDKVIICCGSCANSSTGSDGSGYDIARSFGHTVIKPLPALTYLTCGEDFYRSVAGVRTKARVSIGIGNDGNYNIAASDTGELQLNKTGISGIVVFNLSRLAVQALDAGKCVMAYIDFCPDIPDGEFEGFLRDRIRSQPKRSVDELFIGILAKPLGICICKRCRTELKASVDSLSGKAIKRIALCVKHFETRITGHGDFEHSQTVQGGVSLDEVTDFLESRKSPGLYFAGEILDVNGDCGGYNLQWTASSAIVAACGMTGDIL